MTGSGLLRALRGAVVLAFVLGQLALPLMALADGEVVSEEEEEFVEQEDLEPLSTPEPDPGSLEEDLGEELEFASASLLCEPTGDETLETDKEDYAPEETVIITGVGYAASCDVVVKVTRPNGSVVVGDGSFEPGSDTITTDADGNLYYEYILNGILGEYLVEVLGADDVVLASTAFLDSHPERGCGTTNPLVVNTTDDVVSANDDGLCSLREAILAVNAGHALDAITLPAGIYTLTIGPSGDDNANNGDLDIRATVAINGEGPETTIVQAGSTSENGIDRVFDVRLSGVHFTLNDLTVRHGRTNEAGAGIRVDQSNATLTTNNVVITTNTSTGGKGGGIFSKGNVTLNDSDVSGNVAKDDGGGIHLDESNRTLTAADSTISSNATTDGGKEGGGIWTKGPAILTGSSVQDNMARGHGGGIFSDGGLLTLTDSTVSGNSTTDSNRNGGGIRSNRAVTSTGSTLSGNSATGNGGGLWLDHGSSPATSLANTTITNNTATGNGGGMHIQNGTVNLFNATVSHNNALTSSNTGDGIRRQGGTVNLRNTVLANNDDAGSAVNCSGSPIVNVTNNLDSGTTCGFGAINNSLSSADADLGALQGNGGPTFTRSLGTDSDAIDAASDAVCAAAPVNGVDQRGVDRPQGDHCDIGAYEVNGFGGGDTSATITVTKVWSDGTDAVTINVTCDTGNVDPASAEIDFDPGDSATFTVTDFEEDETCTVEEDQVPAGYSVSYGDGASDDCDQDGVIDVASDGEYQCTVTNTLNEATVTVTKEYSDGNDDEVTITLTCDGGVVSPSGEEETDELEVTFSVEGFEPDDECTVEEDPVPSGYTASYGEGGDDDCDSGGVVTLAVEGELRCTVTNTLNEATITVTKEYSDGNDDEVTINLVCDGGTIEPSDQEETVGLEVTFTVTGFDDGDTCTATEDEVPEGYAANEADCAGIVLEPSGEHECTIYNVESLSLVTAGACTFDRDTARNGQQFPIIFTPDGDMSKISATNPGQFFLNVAYSGASYDLEIEIPYPFVTVGANPVKVYENVDISSNDGKTCFAPSDLIRSQSDQVTWDWDEEDFESDPGHITVELPYGSQFVFVRVHLAYGLKGVATGCTKNDSISPPKANCTYPAISIGDPSYQPYEFSFSGTAASGNTTIESFNVFKRDPGIGGLVTDGETGTPLAGETLRIWLDSKLVDEVTTDDDGWYVSPFKHKGKSANYTVKLVDHDMQKEVAVKSNSWVIVNFVVGESGLAELSLGGDEGDPLETTPSPPPACVPKGNGKNCK